MILCVVGEIGSGKTTVAHILKGRGFMVVELGHIVRDSMTEKGLPITKRSIREYSMKMRHRYGRDIFARYAIRLIRGRKGDIALLGVRTMHELNYFERHLNDLKIVVLLAPQQMRFRRMQERGKPEDPHTFKEFRWLERKEEHGYMRTRRERRHGLLAVMKAADYMIANTGTKTELRVNVNRLIKMLENQAKVS